MTNAALAQLLWWDRTNKTNVQEALEPLNHHLIALRDSLHSFAVIPRQHTLFP